MIWWYWALAVALLLLPPYLFVLAKWAAAGWLAGVRTYFKSRGDADG